MKLVIREERCPQNHRCPSVSVCPQGAITQETPYSLPQIDETKCIMCGKCVRFCPKGAIEKADS